MRHFVILRELITAFMYMWVTLEFPLQECLVYVKLLIAKWLPSAFLSTSDQQSLTFPFCCPSQDNPVVLDWGCHLMVRSYGSPLCCLTNSLFQVTFFFNLLLSSFLKCFSYLQIKYIYLILSLIARMSDFERLWPGVVLVTHIPPKGGGNSRVSLEVSD